MEESLLQEVAVEVNSFLDRLDLGLTMKIPEEIIKFYEKKASKEYQFVYDDEKSLIEQNFKVETKYIISKLYLKYLCNGEEKEEYHKILNNYEMQVEQEKRAKYNPDNIFENKRVIDEQSLEVQKKQSWIKRLFNKIFGRQK